MVWEIHLQLGHCAVKQRTDLLKFGHCQLDTRQIQRIRTKCGYRRCVHRIHPRRFAPDFSFRWRCDSYRYYLPILRYWHIRIVSRTDRKRKKLPRSNHGRFADSIHALLPSEGFGSDVSHCNMPERLGTSLRKAATNHPGSGRPGIGGQEWGGIESHFWAAIYPSAYPSSPSEWTRWVASQIIEGCDSKYLEERQCRKPNQYILTIAAIAQNRAPRSATGIPPSFAMTGRCDVAIGAIACILGRDRSCRDLSSDLTIHQMYTIRKIIDARNAEIKDDSIRAFGIPLRRSVIDRRRDYLPIGASVHISAGESWTGKFRAIVHSDGNLVVERGNKIPTRPTCKNCLANKEGRCEMDRDPIPIRPRNRTNRRTAREFPDVYDRPPFDLTQYHDTPSGIIGVGNDEGAESQLVEHGRQTQGRLMREEDPMKIGLITDIFHGARAFRENNFANRVHILCADMRTLPSDAWVDGSFAAYYEMVPLLPQNSRSGSGFVNLPGGRGGGI